MPKKKTKEIVSKALVLQEISLSQKQQSVILSETPKEFIKSRPIRGGKTAKYVEGGYVVNQLNAAFSPVGWDFDVIKEEITDEAVWVRGKITIHDHKNGYSVSKSQYGQHDRAKGVPLGDTLKAAATDCLKKCASLFGVALDVYWGEFEDEKNFTNNSKPKQNLAEEAEKFRRAKEMLKACSNRKVLFEYLDKLKASKIFTPAQKKEIESLISLRIDNIDNS